MDCDSTATSRKISVPNISYEISHMQEEDIPKILSIRKALKYYTVGSSMRTHFKYHPEGFMVVKTEKGEIIGTCCNVKNQDDLYFGSLYWVHEKYRGCGIAVKMLKSILDNGYNVAFNARFSTDKKNHMLVQNLSIEETDFTIVYYRNDSPANPDVLSAVIPQGVIIEQYQQSHLPLIVKYDFTVVNYKRPEILELSLLEEDSVTLVAIHEGACVGYGSIKTTCEGLGIVGPLYADDPKVAEAMLKKLILSLPEVTGLVTVCLSTNLISKCLFTKLGCSVSSDSPRFYLKERLRVNDDNLYSLFDSTFQTF